MDPTNTKKVCFLSLFYLFLMISLKQKKKLLYFHSLLVCQAFKPEDKKKKARLSMNQQCVSLWVDKTGSSCLVSFSLSYSIGQKVMATGFKSHWKDSSCSARYCLCKVCFILEQENILSYDASQSNKIKMTNEEQLRAINPRCPLCSSAAPNKYKMMKWTGSASFWCFGKFHSRSGRTCLPGYYSWH